MLRREFIKLMSAIVVAPSPPLGGKLLSQSENQYGDFVIFTKSPVVDSDIKAVVNDVFVPQIKKLQKRLNYPWNRKNYVIIFKNFGACGSVDPLCQQATIGWKYTDKEAA